MPSMKWKIPVRPGAVTKPRKLAWRRLLTVGNAKLEKVPPPGAGPPTAAKLRHSPLERRWMPELLGGEALQSNTMSPASSIAGELKKEKVPPPGAGSPLAATRLSAPLENE